MDEEFIEEPQEHIQQFGDDPEESDSFVTKDQHDNFVTHFYLTDIYASISSITSLKLSHLWAFQRALMSMQKLWQMKY